MTSNLCHLHKIGDLLEFNRTVHLHIVALVKVSKLLSRETPDFILLGFWIVNSEQPCLYPTDCQTGTIMQEGVSQTDIHSNDELKQ